MTIAEQEAALDELILAVGELYDEARRLEQDYTEHLDRIPDSHRDSARNLLHYLAVRRHDIRELQGRLHSLGLSSLGRLEAYVLLSLHAVLVALHRLADRPFDNLRWPKPDGDFAAGREHLISHTADLLGPPRDGRTVRVMVTVPNEIADTPREIRDLLASGMDVLRINCAAGDRTIWKRIIEHVRNAESEVGRKCRVLCDLAGPNPRTGPLPLADGILRWQPLLNHLGQLATPAEVWLVPDGDRLPTGRCELPVDRAFLNELAPEDEIHLQDARGKHRWLTVRQITPKGYLTLAGARAFVASDTPLRLIRDGTEIARGKVGTVPPKETSLRLAPGDTLRLTLDLRSGREAVDDDLGRAVELPQIGCTLPEMFKHARPGQRVIFDDGKLAGIIREIDHEQVLVEITSARKGAAKLRGGKSINLPGTAAEVATLTAKDQADLEFISEYADLVGLSFVRNAGDVEHFIDHLDPHHRHKGIVVKIETRQAFEDLPRLLLTAMQHPPIGVMVARGDMGVEMGFRRMAEVQEEILWLCEAAHVPVIWATQVLESMNKRGLPSRAEVTDAAMGGRAECVMLNKGSYLVETVDFLSDVLSRMQDHQAKKRSMLRKLQVSERI